MLPPASQRKPPTFPSSHQTPPFQSQLPLSSECCSFSGLEPTISGPLSFSNTTTCTPPSFFQTTQYYYPVKENLLMFGSCSSSSDGRDQIIKQEEMGLQSYVEENQRFMLNNYGEKVNYFGEIVPFDYGVVEDTKQVISSSNNSIFNIDESKTQEKFMYLYWMKKNWWCLTVSKIRKIWWGKGVVLGEISEKTFEFFWGFVFFFFHQWNFRLGSVRF